MIAGVTVSESGVHEPELELRLSLRVGPSTEVLGIRAVRCEGPSESPPGWSD
jgi:hypothetical protein